MQLAAYTDLLSQLALDPNNPDYVQAAITELDNATLQLENDLDTDFDLITGKVDIFKPYPNEVLSKLRLKRGFITSGSVTAMYARTPEAWFLNMSANITPILEIDYERGSFWVNGAVSPLFGDYNYIFSAQYGQTPFYGIPGSYWQVTYSAGFPVNADNIDQYDPTQVPDWLQKLALLRARIGMGSHPSVVTAGQTFNSKSLEASYEAVVSKKSCYAPDCILPRL
jgi:hypothetical protein